MLFYVLNISVYTISSQHIKSGKMICLNSQYCFFNQTKLYTISPHFSVLHNDKEQKI